MSLKNEQAVVEIILKGQQPNATLKELEASGRALNAQLKRLPMNSKEFAEKSAELQKVNARLRSIREDVKGTSSEFKKFTQDFVGGIKRLATFGGIVEGLRMVWGEFKHGIEIQREFEKSIQNLSAITGASGKDLEFYKDKAVEMSAGVEGGAKAVVEAIKLIASAKPELLSNKVALADVTKQAILLSHAAGMDLPDAATRLTDAMNQFGADASEAAKYVDVLAAAAKYGAAEVPQVTEALLKFGVGAKSFNIDIYESAAAIELLAEKGLKGADAGTMLRNIFAKLSAADVLPRKALEQLSAAGVNIDVLKDKSIPLQDRLIELSKITGNAAAITEVFGLENKTAGEIIIGNIGRLEQLTEQVKETGVAHAQAAVNMDTLDQAFIRAGNSYDNFLLRISQGGIGNSLKQELNKMSLFMDLFGLMLTDKDKLRLESWRTRISKMEDADRAYRMNLLKEQIDLDLAVFKSAKCLSEKEIKLKADEIKKKVDILKIYQEFVFAQNNNAITQETASTEKKVGLIKQLQDDIEALTAQRIDSLSRAEIADLNAQIKRKQEQLDALFGKESEHARKIKDLYKKLKEDIAELEEENKTFGMSDYEKDVRAAFKKFDDTMARINSDQILKQKGHEEEKAHMIAELRKNTANEIEAIDKKHFDALEKEKRDHLKRQEEMGNTAMQNEINRTIEEFDAEIEYNKAHNLSVIELEEDKQRKLQEIRLKYQEKPEDKKKTKEKDLDKDAYRDFYNSLSDFSSTYFQYYQQQQQRQSDQADLKMQDDMDRDKRLLDAKIITQEQYDQRLYALKKEQQNREKQARLEAYQQEKDAALFSTMINGVEAVSKIWSKYAGNPYVAAALTAIQVGLTAAQIATIESTPAPKYAAGGLHDPNGYVNSETMFNSSSGQPFIAGERGAEWIAPNWMLKDPVISQQINMLESIRSSGRNFGSGGNTSPASSGSNETVMNVARLIAENTKAMNRLNNRLDEGIESYMNYDEFKKQNKAIETARNRSAV